MPRRLRASRCVLWPAAAVIAAGVGACGGEPPPPTGSASWVDVALGLGDPFLTERAVEAEIAGCMSAKGWVYRPLTYPPTERPVDTLDDRRRRGFGIAIEADDRDDLFAAGGDDPNADYVAGLDAAARDSYIAALTGDGGCAVTAPATIAEATRAFMGTLPAAVREMIDAYNLGSAPELVEAQAAWAGCMGEHGFTWPDRRAMFADLNAAVAEGRAATDADRARERTVASADWTCAHEHLDPAVHEFREAILAAAEGIEGPAWFEQL